MTLHDIKKQVRKRKAATAVALDQWSAEECKHWPDCCLEKISGIYQLAEANCGWPIGMVGSCSPLIGKPKAESSGRDNCVKRTLSAQDSC